MGQRQLLELMMLAKFMERHDRALAIVVLAINPALLYLIGEPTDPTGV